MTNPLSALYSMGKNYKHPLKIGNKSGTSTFTSLTQRGVTEYWKFKSQQSDKKK